MLFEGEGRRERKRRQERQMKGEGEDIAIQKTRYCMALAGGDICIFYLPEMILVDKST